MIAEYWLVDGIQMSHHQCKNDVDQGDNMIVAKPVIDQQFWILQQDEEKIGNVEACAGGYQVRINNQITQYKTIKMVEQRTGVRFEPPMMHGLVPLDNRYKQT